MCYSLEPCHNKMIIFKMNVVKRVGFCLFEPGVNLSPLGITLICTALFLCNMAVCVGVCVREGVLEAESLVM